MQQQEEKKFKEDYRDIMYCRELIAQRERYIKRLQKLGDSEGYIGVAKEKIGKLQEKLTTLLNGKSYEYWKLAHEELRDLHAKLNRAIARKSAIEKEIIDFKF